MAHEIIKEIGRVFAGNLKEEDLRKSNNAIEKDITSHLNNGIKYLKRRDFNKAKEELNKFIDISKVMFKEDKVNKYFTPENPIEYMLILDNEEGREVKKAGIDFSIGYTHLGVIVVEEGEFSKEIEMLKQALKRNPYNTKAIFEQVKIYKIEGNLEEYRRATIEIISKIYNPLDMARFYRNLGYYYIEKKNGNWQKPYIFIV